MKFPASDVRRPTHRTPCDRYQYEEKSIALDIEACIACGSGSIATVFEKDNCLVLRCSKCGFGRTSPLSDFDAGAYHTREDVPDPRRTLSALASRMSVGGTLLMTTRDCAAPLARLRGRNCRLITPPQHLSFFTAACMRAMLESVGLKTASLTHPGKRVPLSLALYQLQRIAGYRPRSVPLASRLWLPVNLWDTMRVVAVKRS